MSIKSFTFPTFLLHLATGDDHFRSNYGLVNFSSEPCAWSSSIQQGAVHTARTTTSCCSYSRLYTNLGQQQLVLEMETDISFHRARRLA